MSELQRYELELGPFGSDEACMMPDSTGQYVKADDALARIRELEARVAELEGVVELAWDIRREDRDYNPCPDYGLKGLLRDRLNKKLDAWNAARNPK